MHLYVKTKDQCLLRLFQGNVAVACRLLNGKSTCNVHFKDGPTKTSASTVTSSYRSQITRAESLTPSADL